jgi:dienelactone hydrolase
VAAGAAAAAGAASSVAAAAYFARKVLTPDQLRPDDTQILRVEGETVVLAESPETVVPGRYGLWLDQGAGHARVGGIIERLRDRAEVRRILDGVDVGTLAPGAARWNQYYFAGPPDESLGLETHHVVFDTQLGPMPAWLVPARHTGRWAILVHGRGARREECLRAIPALHDAGITALVPCYRNDVGAPAGPDGRYGLGLSEWHDLDRAARFALDSGAGELIMFGWSMGAAIVLQMLDQSELQERVSRVVFDAPVVDWADVLAHHARLNSVPAPVEALSRTLMGHPRARRLVGVREVVEVARTDWVTRADELRHPILLIHSLDDEFVPVGPSQALAAARPDLVDFEPWHLARHTKEWNVDPQRWERLVADFVRD